MQEVDLSQPQKNEVKSDAWPDQLRNEAKALAHDLLRDHSD